jgi:hypothetical protein
MPDSPTYAGHSLPGVAPSPHLSLENAQSIGTGFYKMLPGAVPGVVLQAPDNEDIDNLVGCWFACLQAQ